MSLKPDSRSSRTRSRSRTRDKSSTRERSRSNVRRAPSPPSPPRPSMARDEVGPRYATQLQYPSADAAFAMPAMPGAFDDPPISPPYGGVTSPSDRRKYASGPGAGGGLPYPTTGMFPSETTPYSPSGEPITMGDYKDFPPHERPGYFRQQSDHDRDLAYGGSPYPDAGRQQHAHSISGPISPTTAGQYGGYQSTDHSQHQYPYQYPPQKATDPSQADRYHATRHGSYSQHQPYQYAPQPETVSYTTRPQHAQSPIDYAHSSHAQRDQRPDAQRRTSSKSEHARVVDITPGARHSSTTAASTLMPSMDRLSIGGHGGHGDHTGGGLPPPSPLLEAYHGTYQSVSPMVAAMSLANESDMSDLEPLSSAPKHKSHKSHKHSSSTVSSNSKTEKTRHKSGSISVHKEKDTDKKEKKHVKLYDAEEDARSLADALSHSKIDTDTVCEILPALTHDQMLALRNEYKKHAKVQGRGINIAKHLKLKLTGNFGKAAYVCALGRWESEGYWANFWYQAHGSRRELLIESLMGRTNAEIAQICDSFKDKRYSDDLKRCMEKELKADKFRVAVLMALEGRRQEETDVFPIEYRNKDVEILNRCMKAREGGETAMLEIVVRRSDAHLRDVLQTYERMHGANFAREALKKSNNLVGEVIAHILNGVINRPARDALLLHHALSDIATHNKEDDLRYELLISRLVRFHWDRPHLARVKREYATKYGKQLEMSIEEATKGDFREFMIELCDVQPGAR